MRGCLWFLFLFLILSFYMLLNIVLCCAMLSFLVQVVVQFPLFQIYVVMFYNFLKKQ